jgi:hypothetical protein
MSSYEQITPYVLGEDILSINNDYAKAIFAVFNVTRGVLEIRAGIIQFLKH